jgi:hypothetical protein
LVEQLNFTSILDALDIVMFVSFAANEFSKLIAKLSIWKITSSPVPGFWFVTFSLPQLINMRNLKALRMIGKFFIV